MNEWKKSRRNKWIFEIAVIVAVLGVLTAMAIHRLSGWVSPVGHVGNSGGIRDLREIISASSAFREDEGRYPESIEELRRWTHRKENRKYAFSKDPWGREYGYRLIGGKPQATCLGKDGAEGGEGEDRDFVITIEENPRR